MQLNCASKHNQEASPLALPWPAAFGTADHLLSNLSSQTDSGGSVAWWEGQRLRGSDFIHQLHGFWQLI